MVLARNVHCISRTTLWLCTYIKTADNLPTNEANSPSILVLPLLVYPPRDCSSQFTSYHTSYGESLPQHCGKLKQHGGFYRRLVGNGVMVSFRTLQSSPYSVLFIIIMNLKEKHTPLICFAIIQHSRNVIKMH